MGIFEGTFEEHHIPRTHAEVNKLAVQEARKLKERIFEELGLVESAELIFKAMPNQAERTALSILIRNADNLEDLSQVQEQAEAFKHVRDQSAASSFQALTARVHTVVDDFDEFVRLSTDENSEAGSLLSYNEEAVLEKLHQKLLLLLADMSVFIESNRLKDSGDCM